MKKMISFILIAVLLVGCSNTPKVEEKKEDVFTSASVNNFYGESGLTGDALWDVINNYQAAPTIATVNQDGTPNLAVFMPGGHMSSEGQDYFVLGLSENQTKVNLERDKVGVIALYIYNPTAEAKTERNIGARIKFEYVNDEKVMKQLKEAFPDIVSETAMICKVVEVLPLG